MNEIVFLKIILRIILLILQHSTSILIKIPLSDFDSLFKEKFRKIRSFTESYGLPIDEVFTGEENIYKIHVERKLKDQKNRIVYFNGQIELLIFSQLNLPKDGNFHKFLYHAYIYSSLNEPLHLSLYRFEKLKLIFSKKVSSLHYLSLDGWRIKPFDQLIKEAKEKPTIDIRVGERHRKIDKKRISSTNHLSNIIASVIDHGIISESTITRLVSTEKLLIIHKYAEGLSKLYDKQKSIIDEKKNAIKKLSKLTSKNSRTRIVKARTELSELQERFSRTPISLVLEKYNFKFLFRKMYGVYILPLSQLPRDYSNDHIRFLKEKVIAESKDIYQSYLDDPDVDNDLIEPEHSYIILSHIISINDLDFLVNNRVINYSSPALSSLLVDTYLLNSKSSFSSIYINDIIRNISINHFLNLSNKTDQYISNNFEAIKVLLWKKYNLDIYKPTSFSLLSNTDVDYIAIELHKIDNSSQLFRIRNKLTEIFLKYKELNEEISRISI